VSGVNWLGDRQPFEPSFFNFFEKKNQPENHVDPQVINDIAHVVRYEFWQNPFTYFDLATYSELASQAHAHSVQDDDDVAVAHVNDDPYAELATEKGEDSL
jgi:hypothetical protein